MIRQLNHLGWIKLRALVKHPEYHDELIKLMTGSLTDQQFDTLVLRLGMLGREPHTYAAIAKDMGVSIARIHVVQSDALRKLYRLPKWHPLIERYKAHCDAQL